MIRSCKEEDDNSKNPGQKHKRQYARKSQPPASAAAMQHAQEPSSDDSIFDTKHEPVNIILITQEAREGSGGGPEQASQQSWPGPQTTKPCMTATSRLMVGISAGGRWTEFNGIGV